MKLFTMYRQTGPLKSTYKQKKLMWVIKRRAG